MAITITDPQLLALLAGKEAVELKDPAGRVIGDLVPRLFVPPPGFKSPFSDEEMALRYAEPAEGQSLAEVLREIQAQG